jgi:hypothetical protein
MVNEPQNRSLHGGEYEKSPTLRNRAQTVPSVASSLRQVTYYGSLLLLLHKM